MSAVAPLTLVETNRDRFAREAELKLNAITIPTPHFSPLIRGRDEFELFLRMKRANQMSRVNSCVLRLFDAPSTILTRILANQQTTIGGSLLDEGFNDFLQETLVVIDPATEYLFYEFNLQRFNSKLMPQALRDYARRCENKKKAMSAEEYGKWKNAYHRLFWTEIYNDPNRRVQLVSETLDLQLRCGGKVTLAPGPLVESMTTLAIAIKMNENARQLSRAKAAESATYLSLHKSVLADDRLMDELKSYIEKDESRLTILKFKQLDLSESSRIAEREAYRQLLLELGLVRQRNSHRGFMLLEAANQAFPSATVAFDIVNTSFTGQDKDSSFGRTPYGSWYDPKEMIQRQYEQAARLFRTNGGMPHGCRVCRGINDFQSLTPEEWYADRRVHYCFLHAGIL